MTQYIGKKLKELRQSKKMTQEEVGKVLNITRSTISNYEIGRRTPHMKELQKISDFFGVGLDYFGISSKDEAIDLLARAKDVFKDRKISRKTKENLYFEFMKLYLEMKGEKIVEKKKQDKTE